MTTAMRKRPSVLDIVAAVAVLAAFGFAVGSPRVESQGESARMLFIHVPTIWLAYLAFVVTFVASVALSLAFNISQRTSLAAASCCYAISIPEVA